MMKEQIILIIVVMAISVVLGLLIANGWCRPWSKFNLPHFALCKIKKMKYKINTCSFGFMVGVSMIMYTLLLNIIGYINKLDKIEIQFLTGLYIFSFFVFFFAIELNNKND